MAFKTSARKSIKGDRECLWCGWKRSFVDAVHIVDEIDQPAENGVWLCKNCHAVFEDVFRPRLFKALIAYGIPSEQLPPSWKQSNKISSKKSD